MNNIKYEDLIDINLWCRKIILGNIEMDNDIREQNLLMSIPNAINQSFGGEDLYPTIYDKSSYLWYSLTKYHCFIDGNKRTALVATLVYLIINGHMLEIDKLSLYDLCIDIANGKAKIDEISEYIAKNSKIYNENKGDEMEEILNLLSKNDDLIIILEKLSQ